MEKSSLTALTRQQLTLARNVSSGRSSQTVYGGHEPAPRHTGPADRCPDRPSGENGEAAEHAPQVGPVSTPGARVPSAVTGPDGGELAAVTIMVNGRNVKVPEHYRIHVAEKMAHLQRYNDKIIHYDVELFHENNHRQSKLCQRVEITGTGNGPVVRAEARGPDFYAALAAALTKLKTQLRRSHDRRQVHHGHRTPTSVAEATGTLELRTMSTPPGTANDDGSERQRESSEVEGPGHIVREEHSTEPMTVDQAL
jgi:ribosomal subunit interface protein